MDAHAVVIKLHILPSPGPTALYVDGLWSACIAYHALHAAEQEYIGGFVS